MEVTIRPLPVTSVSLYKLEGKLLIVTLSDPLPAVLAVVEVPLPFTTTPAASAIEITTPDAG